MIIQHSEEFDQYYSFVDKSESLEHFGILGMRWGIRRWQNKDGTLTPAGYAHYGVNKGRKAVDKVKKSVKKFDDDLTRDLKPVDDVVNKISDKMANIFSETRRKENKAKKEQEKQAKKEQQNKEIYEKLKKAESNGGLKGNKESVKMQKAFIDKYEKEHSLNDDELERRAKQGEKMFEEKYGSEMKAKADQWVDKYLKDHDGNVDMNKMMSDFSKWTNSEMSSKNNENYNKERYRYDVQDEDLGEWASARDAIKSYGLKNDDLAMDHDGYVVRKDGKQFEVTLPNGKKYSYEYLDEVAYAMDNGAVPVGKGNEKREQERAKNQRRAEQLKKSGYSIEEIAQKLGVPKGTVNAYLYQG